MFDNLEKHKMPKIQILSFIRVSCKVRTRLSLSQQSRAAFGHLGGGCMSPYAAFFFVWAQIWDNPSKETLSFHSGADLRRRRRYLLEHHLQQCGSTSLSESQPEESPGLKNLSPDGRRRRRLEMVGILVRACFRLYFLILISAFF